MNKGILMVVVGWLLSGCGTGRDALQGEVSSADLGGADSQPGLDSLSGPEEREHELPDHVGIQDLPLDEELAPQPDSHDASPWPETDVPPAEAVTPLVGSCAEVWNCGADKGCYEIDSDCWDQCLYAASNKAKAEFDAILECYEPNCSFLQDQEKGDCLWKLCGTQVFLCIGGDGTADCRDTMHCVGDCKESEDQCFFDCMMAASEEAIEVFSKMADEKSSESFFYMLQCLGGYGDAGCGETMTCLQGCNPGEQNQDPDCVMACVEASSPGAQEQLQAAMACQMQGQGACWDTMLPCFGGSGNMSCSGAMKCLQDCEAGVPPYEDLQGEGGECFLLCAGQLSQQGVDDMLSFLECYENVCGDVGQGQECPGADQCMPLCPGLSPGT